MSSPEGRKLVRVKGGLTKQDCTADIDTGSWGKPSAEDLEVAELRI